MVKVMKSTLANILKINRYLLLAKKKNKNKKRLKPNIELPPLYFNVLLLLFSAGPPEQVGWRQLVDTCWELSRDV